MNKLLRDDSGASMVEMALVLPLVVALTFGAVQSGLIFYALASMESAARVTARALSVGEADDEANGATMTCSSVTGTSTDGNKSAEKIACDRLTGLPGTFSVSAGDGTAGAFAKEGTDIQVTISVNRSSIVVADPFGFLPVDGVFSRTANLRKE